MILGYSDWSCVTFRKNLKEGVWSVFVALGPIFEVVRICGFSTEWHICMRTRVCGFKCQYLIYNHNTKKYLQYMLFFYCFLLFFNFFGCLVFTSVSRARGCLLINEAASKSDKRSPGVLCWPVILFISSAICLSTSDVPSGWVAFLRWCNSESK